MAAQSRLPPSALSEPRLSGNAVLRRIPSSESFARNRRHRRTHVWSASNSECRNPHHLIRVLQFDLVAPIGSEAGAPIHAEDLHIETLAIDAHDQVVIGVRTAIHSGLNKMLQFDLAGFVLLQVSIQVRLAAVRIDWRSATAGDD